MMEGHSAYEIRRHVGLRPLVAGAVLVGCLWSYWPTLRDLWDFWQRNADYSVGQLVPLVAAYFIWTDRATLRKLPLQVCWWGLSKASRETCASYCGARP